MGKYKRYEGDLEFNRSVESKKGGTRHLVHRQRFKSN